MPEHTLQDWYTVFTDRAEISPLVPTRPWNQALSTWLRTVDDAALAPGAGSSTAIAIRSALYLWNDCLDDSHRLSQSLKTSTGSYLHGIMHRREPDYQNAKYWFRNAGNHPVADPISVAITDAFPDGSTLLPPPLTREKSWNPASFVNACEQAEGQSGAAAYQILQQLQDIEIRCCLDLLMKDTDLPR